MLVSVSKQCSESKVKYSLQSGIVPYLKIQLLNNFRGRPFCFITEQIKKQYDLYFQYWSVKQNEVISSYCGSFFLGHCKFDLHIEHFNTLQKYLNWDIFLLHQLSMDGPISAGNYMFKVNNGNTRTGVKYVQS